MIYFESTYYLYLLALTPVVILIYAFYRKQQLKINAGFGDDKLITRLVTRRNFSVYIQLVKFLSLLLAVIFLVLALADPYLPFETQYSATFPQTDIVFAVDVSKSMLAADVLPNRLAQAQGLILSILNNLHGERVALVVFSGKADVYIPLTADYGFVKSAVLNISNELITKQGTSISDALKISSLVLNNKPNELRIISLISDGETSEPGVGKIADSINKTGVNLFAFGIGTAAGAEIIEQNPKTRELGPLKKNGSAIISHLEQGNLLRVVNNRQERYSQLIDKTLSTNNFITAMQSMQRAKKAVLFSHKSYFQIFLLIALVMLILEILI